KIGDVVASIASLAWCGVQVAKGTAAASSHGSCYFVAAHGLSGRGIIKPISEPVVVQELRDAAGAARSFAPSARVSRPTPGRECTHGRCRAWCLYIRSADEN